MNARGPSRNSRFANSTKRELVLFGHIKVYVRWMAQPTRPIRTTHIDTPGDTTTRVPAQQRWDERTAQTQPRRNGEPSWCTGGHPQGDRHRSQPVAVGDRSRTGIVSAWLMEHGPRGMWLRVNAAYMTGVVADIDLDDATELRDGLTGLLKQAGVE